MLRLTLSLRPNIKEGMYVPIVAASTRTSIIKNMTEENYTAAKTARDYKKVLKLFNRKTLIDSIGCCFGLTNQDYSDYILRQLNGANADTIKSAIAPYLPTGIPR